MFETLTQRLDQISPETTGSGENSPPEDVDLAMREVRLALLEADVHFTVVKDFIARVRQRAVGSGSIRGADPGPASDQDCQ